MDIAASEFFKEGKYDLDFKNPETKESDWISSDQLLEMYQGNIILVGKQYLIIISCQALSVTILSSPLRIPLTRMTGRAMPS